MNNAEKEINNLSNEELLEIYKLIKNYIDDLEKEIQKVNEND